MGHDIISYILEPLLFSSCIPKNDFERITSINKYC